MVTRSHASEGFWLHVDLVLVWCFTFCGLVLGRETSLDLAFLPVSDVVFKMKFNIFRTLLSNTHICVYVF